MDAPLKSWRPIIAAAIYALTFSIVFALDFATGWSEPWATLVFLMSYPGSMLLMFFGAWSIAHGAYDLDYYFIPCVIPNILGIYWLVKKAYPLRSSRQTRLAMNSVVCQDWNPHRAALPRALGYTRAPVPLG